MMAEQVLFTYTSIKDDAIEKLINTVSSDNSSDNLFDNIRNNLSKEESGNEFDEPILKSKKRPQRLSESCSEPEDQKHSENVYISNQTNVKKDTKIVDTRTKNSQRKSRIRSVSSSDDELMMKAPEITVEKFESRRVKNRKRTLKNKFNDLVSKQKRTLTSEAHTDSGSEIVTYKTSEYEESEENDTSRNKAFKEKQIDKLSIICDPDSSSDEDVSNKNRKKTAVKSNYSTLNKVEKITAKQAMVNMQKIKSESSRMLREKAVSLPYHRPKALSLKDVMNRRKPALAPDGKALSVKMTAEQLQEYALQLEQRQKEIMELCKSEDDDDDLEDEKISKDEIIDKIANDNLIESNSIDVHTNVDLQNKSNGEIEGTILNKMHSSNDNSKPVACESDFLTNETESTNTQNVGTIPDKNEIANKMNIKESVDNFTSETDKSDINVENKDDSQIMELFYNSEKDDNINSDEVKRNKIVECSNPIVKDNEIEEANNIHNVSEDFLEDNFFDEIEEFAQEDDNKQANINSSNKQPKLTGAPGMFIDLDNTTNSEKKLSGVELLKERFKYFARLKSLEDQEREREKKCKPGLLHLKLKHELENQIAEQRSIEWKKRLEQEKQQQLELNAVRSDESEADDIEKLEAKLEKDNDTNVSNNESEVTTEEEEEICEEDCVIEDRPRKRNPMIDDEAEESELEDNFAENKHDDVVKEDKFIEDNEDFDGGDEDSSDDESSESDEDTSTKPKKGRILKAFEDSDDEDHQNINNSTEHKNIDSSTTIKYIENVENDIILNQTQDEELQLAQEHKISSENIQDLDFVPITTEKLEENVECLDKNLGSQTFSITNSLNGLTCLDKLVSKEMGNFTDDCLTSTNSYIDSFSQNVESQQIQNSITESQELGSDVADLCTGKFYDNPFISQIQENSQFEDDNVNSLKETITNNENFSANGKDTVENENDGRNQEKSILNSIIEELDNPQLESPNQFKYFVNNSTTRKKENVDTNANNEVKKKFVIESDDETNEENIVKKERKFVKKRKQEKRVLQFSDDEDCEHENESEGTFKSDIDEESERYVEYDSEENEVEVQPVKAKKNRVAGDFFEREAELSSEDEWVGSGDEDEAGLDLMEREEGDDEVFHEGKLRNELGQIHMRDVLDQDKREVRLLQELLFEDGDLGDGHRQRKFRWRNADDTEEIGTALDEYADTQEEEFESEEQWRKQRHEREVFLRKMVNRDDENIPNESINRTSILKANLSSRNTCNLIPEAGTSKNESMEKTNVPNEKKTFKDVPSPKKPFPIFQQNHRGSLLSRGKSALARLAAIATPLAGDDNATKVSTTSNKRNFVFTALSQDDVQTKVSKRKADATEYSPVLIKKLKNEEKQKHLRSSNDKLFPYAEEKVKQFLESQWDNEDVKEVIIALRKLSLEDKEKSVDGAVVIPGEDATKEEQIEGLVNNVKWQMSADRKTGPLMLLQGLIWKQGYDSGDIKGHVYDDVLTALEQWKSIDGQKVYIYSSGSVQAQKLLFGQSQAGDLLKFIEGHFDTAVGAKQDAASYAAITKSIGCKPEEILFLTDIVKEAEAARSAGLYAALVSREGNAPLPDEATATYAVLHSLAQLAASNKRKTEPQDELPAKIAKTDNEDDVKVALAVQPASKQEEKVNESSEKMEVEEEVLNKEIKSQNENEKKIEPSPTLIDTTIEEVTDANKLLDVPVADLEPVITENVESTAASSKEEKQTEEKMDTDTSENNELINVPKEKDEKEEKENAKLVPVAEETPPAVITEIEEVTNENVLGVEEIIDDIEPVIEEPETSEDMEVLQSVGEVLEKECDEILSKVQDVTNLDTIPVKPLLNTIAEETMETENLDSNDIVERILDTELELEMKQNEDIESKKTETLTEVSADTKTSAEVNSVSESKEMSQKRSEHDLEENVTEKSEEETDIKLKSKEEKDMVSQKTDHIDDGNTEEKHKAETKSAETPVEKSVEEVSSEKCVDSETKVPVESKDNTSVPDKEAKQETESTESQVNGKATNGEAESLSLNGDVSKDEELSSRLSAENGKQEDVNGSNGNSVESAKAPENKAEAEVSDIKVKTVPSEEPHTDPIEQPTEA
ncbi:claspin-like [Battus philenor]|uniref:claspin-like n=1 Tax=Battus philenor TaxID=42288 RepID=UPI0035D0AED6